MSLRGIIFILTIAIVYAVIERDKIYNWLTSVMSDDNNNNKETEEE